MRLKDKIIEWYGNVIVEAMFKHVLWFTRKLEEEHLFRILKDRYKEYKK